MGQDQDQDEDGAGSEGQDKPVAQAEISLDAFLGKENKTYRREADGFQPAAVQEMN
jgi:hypothetical protein